MKKFIIKIMFFLPLVIFVVYCNYYIDPANLFRDEYEQGIAKILIEGKNVENIVNFDERLVQKYYISNLKQAKDVIIIGSSRSMQINSNTLRNNNIFNSSVSGASLEDYMVLYEMYRERNLLPKKIIIGIDPWIFNKNNEQDRWKSMSKYYYNIEEILGYDKSNNKIYKPNKYYQLFSIKYFQSSIKNILKGKDDYFATSEKQSINQIKLSDGSLVYNYDFREAKIEEVENKANEYISRNSVYRLNKYKELEKKYVERFEKFIKLIISDNVEIVFFLPPYYPDVYSFLVNSEEFKIITDVEKYLNEFAYGNDIQVFGSYNPINEKEGYQLTKEHFYDGMHPKTESMEIIFN